MKSKFKILSIGLAVLFTGFLLSCNSASSGNVADDTSAKTASNKLSKKDNKKAGECFTNYYGENMFNLLTKEEITKYVSLDLDNAFTQDFTDLSEDMQSFYYQIKAGDEREKRLIVKGEDYGPIDYEVGIKGIKVYGDRIEDPYERFLTENHIPTKADKEAIDRGAQAAKDDMDMGTEAQREEAVDAVVKMANKLKFTQIDGLGDAAAWSHNFHYLNVLVGRTVVSINVDVNDDENKNMEIAQNLAKEVLKKCM